MAKRSKTRLERRRAERGGSAESSKQPSGQSSPSGWIPWSAVGWGAIGVAIVALLGAVFVTAGEPLSSDPVTESLACSNAGTDSEIYRVQTHTVYHSVPALPMAAAPRADGQPTLV
jgi:hypothetical protein